MYTTYDLHYIHVLVHEYDVHMHVCATVHECFFVTDLLFFVLDVLAVFSCLRYLY